jgi:hypothetical protein
LAHKVKKKLEVGKIVLLLLSNQYAEKNMRLRGKQKFNGNNDAFIPAKRTK